MVMAESEDTDIIPSPTSIVRAPSAITPVNSAIAKSVIPNDDSLAKVTFWKLDLDTILDGLIPDPLPESSGKDNAIHHLNIIIFGKPILEKPPWPNRLPKPWDVDTVRGM